MNEETPTPADENVERLIGEAYRPDAIDLGFAQRTLARLERLSAERRLLSDPKQRILWLAFANAAAILMLIVLPPLYWHFFADTGDDDKVMPRQRSTSRPLRNLELGQTVTTAVGEKSAFRLSGGSAVFLNQNTKVRLETSHRLMLLAGEIYVEIAPGKPGNQETAFAISAHNREITGLDTHFAVRTEDRGSSVLVARGQVKVSGIEKAVSAGQRLGATSEQATMAPPAGHELEWTRELFEEEPLVPSSEYRDGAGRALPRR